VAFAAVARKIVLALAGLALTVGCAPPQPSASSALGKKGLIDAVNKAVNQGECATAYSYISSLYNSSLTDNEARILMATVYGCYAGLSTTSTLTSLISDSDATTAGGIWRFVTKLFPSTTTDKVVEYGNLGIESLLSVLRTGVVVIPTEQINAGGYNPGSMRLGDRTDEANMFLFFMAMPTIGGFNSRYGNPDATGAPGAPAPFTDTTGAGMTDASCAYASAVVNFADSLDTIVALVPSSMAGTISTIKGLIQTEIYQACDDGCTGAIPLYSATGSLCTIAAGCAGCPMSLRKYNSCTAGTTNESACAAAGVIRFMNEHPAGWN